MNKEYRLNLYLSYAHALSDSAHIIFGLTLYFVSDNLDINISALNLNNDIHKELVGGALMGRQIVIRFTSTF